MSWVLLVVLIVISYVIVSLAVLSFFFPSVRNQLKSIFGFSQSQANVNNGAGVDGQNQQEEQPHIFNNHRDQVQCPICIDDLGDDQSEGGLAAMCSHIYCAKCIMSYWRTKREHKIEFINFQIDCAISHFQLADSEMKQSELGDCFCSKTAKLCFIANVYIKTYKENLLIFLQQMLKQYILLMAIYFLSPFDLIPEFIFGIFGMIDDLIVVIYAFVAISSVFYQFMVDRNREEVRAR